MIGVGTIYLARETGGGEFTQEDEETLVMFASQAAMVVSNARRYREERRARTDLETLIDTSPVGVVVFDALTGTIPCPSTGRHGGSSTAYGSRNSHRSCCWKC